MSTHHSYKEFHEAKDSEKLPFNLDPPRLIGEKSDFLSLPIKRNAKLFGSAKKEFKLQDIYKDPRKVVPEEEGAYLSFEKALTRHIDEITNEDSSKIHRILSSSQNMTESDEYYMDIKTLRPNHNLLNRKEDDLVLAHYPSSTQWALMDQLRIHAGRPERSENGITMLADYYAQLQYLEAKFPFDAGKMNIQFVWYSSLYPDELVSTTCIQYEKASVLFNIAAVYSQLAAIERLSSHNGKKKASMQFQKAAGNWSGADRPG